jgi:hypothetical protein
VPGGKPGGYILAIGTANAYHGKAVGEATPSEVTLVKALTVLEADLGDGWLNGMPYAWARLPRRFAPDVSASERLT